MAWIVLQPNLFMDTWIPAVVGGAALAGRPVTLVGQGQRRHSMIAARDVASFAVSAIDQPGAQGQTLVIGGPEPVSFRDAVSAFERELGRELSVHTIEPGQSVPGPPAAVIPVLAGLDAYDTPLDTTQLTSQHKVRLTTLAEFVHSFVTSGRPPSG